MEDRDAFCGACGSPVADDAAPGTGDEERGQYQGETEQERPAEPGRRDAQDGPQDGAPGGGQGSAPGGNRRDGAPGGYQGRGRQGQHQGANQGQQGRGRQGQHGAPARGNQGGPAPGQVRREQPPRRPGRSGGGTSRRDLLKYGGGAAVLAGGGWLAYDRLLGGGGDGAMRDRKWLVAPDVLGVDRYQFGRVAADTVRGNESSLYGSSVSELQNTIESLEEFGVSYDRTQGLLIADSFVVVTGSIDQQAANEGFQSQDFEDRGEYGGYQVYDNGTAVGFDGDAMIIAPTFGSLTPQDRLRAVIDASGGSEPRYHESRASCDDLMSELGQGLAVAGSASDESAVDEDLIAAGLAHRLNGDRLNFRLALVFRDASAVDVSSPGDVQNYGFDPSRLSDPQLSTDGRIVRIDDELPTDGADFMDDLP